jgi:hypothetical protein
MQGWGRLPVTNDVLGLPVLYDLLRGARLAVLGRLLPRGGLGLRIPPVEVLLDLRKVLLGGSDQPTSPQRRLPLLLARKIVRERRGVLGADGGGRLGGRRRRIGLARFESAREFLEEPSGLLPISRGVARKKGALGQPHSTLSLSRTHAHAPSVVTLDLFLEHRGRGRWKRFHVEALASGPNHRGCSGRFGREGGCNFASGV